MATHPLTASGDDVADFTAAVRTGRALTIVTAAGRSVRLSARGARLLGYLLSASACDVEAVEQVLTGTSTGRRGRPDRISPEDAATLLGVSRPTVVRWIAHGLLDDDPVGTHHRLDRAQVLALAERRRTGGHSQAQ